MMWMRSSGYVLFALVSGAMAAAGVPGLEAQLAPLVVLWAVADLCIGTASLMMRSLARSGASPQQRSHRWRRVAGLVVSACGGALLISQSPAEARWLLVAGLVVGPLMAIATTWRPVSEMAALVQGLQVVVAWACASVSLGDTSLPVTGLALVAGAGTTARLWHHARRGPLSLWVTRASWTALVAALVLARQPLLAGLVAVSAIADDLYRVQPLRNGDAGMLASVLWAGSWILVAFASTYWSLAV